MQNTSIKNLIKETLKTDERIWFTDDETNQIELNQIKLIDLVEKTDEKIINILLQNEILRKEFFVKIKDVYVFKTRDFIFFLEENKLDNSYTSYKNRIGLTDGKRFLKDTSDVVLDFPYKDCILEGGQSNEDGTDTYFEYDETVTKAQEKKGLKAENYNKKQVKRKEIFFNSVLAQDEIDRLFDRKALINWKKFDKNGEQTPKNISRDENGTIKDNLIIKGNNLLALHSLKSEFAGKIKLIYIDPPYNTGGDANIFTYNNTFNHSTWLTFMKNRLEVAKNLLRDDGFISIAIDHFELGYLLVLSDEIFGRENRLGLISILHNPEGRQNAKYFTATNEFLLVYRKSSDKSEFKSVYLQENIKDSKNIEDVYDKSDEIGLYKEEEFIRLGGGNACLRKNKPNGWYPIYVKNDLKELSIEKKKGFIEVLPITDSGQERTWKIISKSFEEKFKLGDIYAKKYKGKIKIYEKYRIDKGSPITTCWINKKYNAKKGGTNLLEKLFGKKLFSYPKSIYTVLDTLRIMTSDDDIILDFHAGSGTTGHATFELNKEDGGNRQFILVEQLEEHIEICNERNQKVLSKENIDDSFLYCELAEWNEKAKAEILEQKDFASLKSFFRELYEKYFLNYNLKTKEFVEKTIEEENFSKLSFNEQKAIFIAMLDNNQMYVNQSEIDDKKYGVSETDKVMSGEFYNVRK